MDSLTAAGAEAIPAQGPRGHALIGMPSCPLAPPVGIVDGMGMPASLSISTFLRVQSELCVEAAAAGATTALAAAACC